MTLSDRSIAVLAYPGYQELEFWYPVLRAREDGVTVTVVTSSPEGCESYLGYPVVGDVAATEVNVDSLDALVVPGTVKGRPEPSAEQIQLIKAAQVAGRRIYTVGNGAELVQGLGASDESRHAADADGLPELVRQLCADLTR